MSSSIHADLRHLRQAVTMLINGIMREHDNGTFTDYESSNPPLNMIGAAIIAALDDWDYISPEQACIENMQAMLDPGFEGGESPRIEIIRAVLAEHDLLP